MKTGDDHKRLTLQGDDGYALIIVLLVITLMLIASLSIIGVSLTRTQQNAHETFRVQATNAAEIGLKAYDQKINAAIQTINEQTPTSSDQFQNLFSGYLPAAALSRTLNNLQNTPSYSVKVSQDMGTNAVKWTLTSVGTVNGVIRTIQQVKKITYNPLLTPEIQGLAPPYMKGSVIVNPGDWDCKDHPNNNVYLNGATGNNNCVGVTEQKVDLSGVIEAFNQMPMASSSAPYIPIDKKNNLTINGNISGDRYIVGDVQIPDNTVFENNVYFQGNVTIGNGVTFKGNVYITGNASSDGNITLNGNLYCGGILDFDGDDEYDGYVYVGGNLIRGSDNNPKDSLVDFKSTVYVNGNMDTKSNKTTINFEHGIVINGSANPQTSANGLIQIGSQLPDPGSGVAVTVTTDSTAYQ